MSHLVRFHSRAWVAGGSSGDKKPLHSQAATSPWDNVLQALVAACLAVPAWLTYEDGRQESGRATRRGSTTLLRWCRCCGEYCRKRRTRLCARLVANVQNAAGRRKRRTAADGAQTRGRRASFLVALQDPPHLPQKGAHADDLMIVWWPFSFVSVVLTVYNSSRSVVMQIIQLPCKCAMLETEQAAIDLLQAGHHDVAAAVERLEVHIQSRNDLCRDSLQGVKTRRIASCRGWTLSTALHNGLESEACLHVQEHHGIPMLTNAVV